MGCPLVEIPDKNETDFSIAQTIEDVKKADIAIFAGGLDADWEGEEKKNMPAVDGFNKGDRSKIELPRCQLETLKAMYETKTPVVFVLLAGSSISFEGLDDNVDAILTGFYPGQRGGDAVASVLFGDYNPGGRLPVTFYSSTDELGDFQQYDMAGGKGKTYRYYKGKALYPFGHGLSYTTFEYSDMKLDHSTIDGDDRFTVSAKIKNTGDRDGEEVVQLYVRDIESAKTMPIKQLRGFERIELKKGEQKEVFFELNAAKDLCYYNRLLQKYTVESGEFEIQIGASSSDIRLKGSITVR